MTERKLASLRQVSAIVPIPDADRIEVAVVDGWNCVVKKGEFRKGDFAFYFEIDSALPVDSPYFEFLAPSGVKKIEGKDYHVLRTRKLRGVYSQGLLLPTEDIPDWEKLIMYGERDLSGDFGVIKWEPPIPAELSGAVVGNFPTDWVHKTDAERVQNLTEVYHVLKDATEWYATEKVDGTSTTYIMDSTGLRVCSRNLELKPNPDLTQMKVAEEIGLDQLEEGFVVQGELYGEGIQRNPLQIKGQRLAIFNVFKGRNTPPLPREEWPEFLIPHAVPILDLKLPETVAEAVDQVDGLTSQIAAQRPAEGVVWHSVKGTSFSALGGRACFKAINNKYLSKQKD